MNYNFHIRLNETLPEHNTLYTGRPSPYYGAEPSSIMLIDRQLGMLPLEHYTYNILALKHLIKCLELSNNK